MREDPVLAWGAAEFAGTERAVHFSLDDGETWQPLRLNMPATSIRDLVIHNDDVVVGTHGRSFWILGDVLPSDEKLRCPSCNGIDIRHSLQRGPLDALMTAFGRKPFRCRACERRFYVHVATPGEDDSESVDQQAQTRVTRPAGR